MLMLDGWYALVDFMLPFPWAAHTFMKNAFFGNNFGDASFWTFGDDGS